MGKENEKKQNFNIRLTLDAAKKMLTYFDDEFLESYEEFISALEEDKNDDNQELEYYDELRDILEDFTYELKKEIRKKERAVAREKLDDSKECENILKKLNFFSSTILKKIGMQDGIDETNLICKLYWYLHSSFDKTGELIFTEKSLEDLLEVDRYQLEKFLKKISSIEVKIGNRKGRLIESYKFLNTSTVKINYNIYIVKPHTAQFKDTAFKMGTAEAIEVSLLKK